MNSTMQLPAATAVASDRTENRTDEELLLEYRSRGTRRAFDVLVHRYESELYGYLRNYLGDAEMAADVFQQTFLQVHLKCGQFEAGRRVRPWLYTVATNQAIDMKRRTRRHRMVSLDRQAGGNAYDGLGTLAELLDSDEPGPDHDALSTERDEQVHRAVRELPEQTRRVVLLVYFQGLKYREAAEVLSIPVGTVKSRLHAAMGKLSGALAPAGMAN